MSGSNVPYQLRPNKFVERQLFYELLEAIHRARPMTDYGYFSMGGKFLVDHSALHARFDMKNLYSIEGCSVTYKRQLFNRPFKFIRCWNELSSTFVGRFEEFVSELGDKSLIAWLDYTKPKDRRNQLEELQTLVSKMRPYDVFKITMNASTQTLEGGKEESRLDRIRKQLGEDAYLPNGVGRPDVAKSDKFAVVLAKAIKTAVLESAENAGLIAIPLAVFRYSDGQQMLTVTGILMEEDKKEWFLDATKLNEWPFLPDNWATVKLISVPDLSQKERRFLDERLFSDPTDELHATLSFKFDKDFDKSFQILNEYLTHYRRYPNFIHATT